MGYPGSIGEGELRTRHQIGHRPVCPCGVVGQKLWITGTTEFTIGNETGGPTGSVRAPHCKPIVERLRSTCRNGGLAGGVCGILGIFNKASVGSAGRDRKSVV